MKKKASESDASSSPRKVRPEGRIRTIALGVFIFFLVLGITPYAVDTTYPKELAIQWTAAALGAVALFNVWRDSSTLRLCPFLITLTANIALYLLTACLAVNRAYAGMETVGLFSLYVLYLVTGGLIRTPQRAWGIAVALCAAMAIATVYGFFQRAGLDPFPWQDTDQMLREAPSTFGNPNYASHALVFATILAIGLLFARRALWPLAFLGLFVAHFALTQTRGSLLGLFVAALLLLATWTARRFTDKPGRVITAALITLVLLGAVGAGLGVKLSQEKYGAPVPLQTPILLRAQSFEGAARMVADRPLIGRGLGGYYLENPYYWTPYEQDIYARTHTMNDHVHNETLEFGVDGGLPGAALYLAFMVLGVFYGLRLGLTAQDRPRAVFGYAAGACFAAALVDGQFGFNMHVPVSAAFAYLLAGMLAGLSTSPQRTPRPRPARAKTVVLFFGLLVGYALLGLMVALGVREFASLYGQKRASAALYYNVPAEAQRAYQKALAYTPYDWSAWYNYGRVCLALEQNDKAIGAFRQTLRLNPTYLDAHVRLAQQWFNRGVAGGPQAEEWLSKAAEEADRAAALAPDYPETVDIRARIQFLMAERLNAKGDAQNRAAAQALFERIDRDLRKTLDLTPDSPTLLRIRAQNSAALGRRGEAAEALYRAIQAQPTDLEIWRVFWAFSQKYDFYGPFMDASTQCLASIPQTLSPPWTSALSEELRIWRGATLQEKRAPIDAALSEFREAVAAAPQSPKAWLAYHAFALSAHRQSEFADDLNRAASETPANPTLRGADAVLPIFRDGVSAIAPATDRFLQTPAETPPAAWLAQVIAAEAAAATDLKPSVLASVRYRLGRFLVERGELATGRPLLIDALKTPLEGDDAIACAKALAKACLLQNDARQALETANWGTQRAPNDLEFLWLRAKAYALDGQNVLARMDYDLLLQANLPPQARQIAQQERDALPE